MTNQAKTRVADWLVPNATVFIASGCIMVIELVAGRLVSQHLGQSLYTWTSIIGIVLAGISIGNYIGGRLADRFRPARTLTVMFILASATALTIPGLNALMGAWSWMWEQSWPLRIVIHVLVTFLLPSTVLGTISPLVAKMALNKSTHTGRTIGDVYAWGAAGSIVGTFLAGFYLVAVMGTIAVVLAVSGVLAVLGLAYGSRFWASYVWAVACSVLLFAGLGAGPTAEAVGLRLGLREMIDDAVVLFNESQYSRIVITEVGGDTRSMHLDKLLHSKINLADPGDLQYSYHWIYAAVTDIITPPPEPIRTFAIGGGGFAHPNYIEVTRPGSYIDVSEIDPAVTEAAFEAFGLPRDTTMEIFNMDARNHVNDLLRRKRSGEQILPFDYIYGDTFNDYTVPYHLTTREFNEELSELLAEDGLYLLNMIDMESVGLLAGAVVSTCRQTFPYVYVFTCAGDPNRRDTFVIVCSRKERDMEPALQLLRERHRFKGRLLSPERADALAERGGLVLTDNFAPVENLLVKMMKHDKGEAPQKHLLEGEMLARAGKLDQALKHFRRALELNPENPVLTYNMALAYAESGDVEQAYALYQKTLAQDPRHTQALNNMAIIHARAGDMESAVRLWERVLEIAPHSPATHDNLAIVLAQRGRMDEAIEHWQISLAGAPENPGTHHNLGSAFALKRDLAGAARHYREALRLLPDYPEAHCNLADILASQGDSAGAATHYLEALRLQSGMPAAQAGLDALGQAGP